jgi:hypothetical protein
MSISNTAGATLYSVVFFLMTESRIKTYIKTRLRAPPEGLVLRWAKKSKVHRPPAENQHNIKWVYFLSGGV